MPIPQRTEELLKEAGFWGDAWNAVSGVGKGIVQGVEGAGKVVGDLATGNIGAAERAGRSTFNSVGKDLGQAAQAAGKAGQEGLHDVGQAAKATGNFVKNHAGEIALGAGLLALNAIPGVGEVADAALLADTAATAAEATTVGAEAAAAGAEGAAAGAEGAAGAAESAAGAGESVGGKALTDAATKGLEDAAGTPLKSSLEKGLERAGTMTEDSSSAASDTASATSKGTSLMDKAKSFMKGVGKSSEEASKPATGDSGLVGADGSPISSTATEAATEDTQSMLSKGLDMAKGVAKATVPAAAAGQMMQPDTSQMQTTLDNIQNAVTPQPQSTIPVQPLRQIDLNPTGPAQGIPGVAATPTQQANPLVITGNKIMDLVEEFGLYPEDIKRSLTTWV